MIKKGAKRCNQFFFLFVNNRKQADSAPLMTRAMREVRQESEMYKYDKVLVNINL